MNPFNEKAKAIDECIVDWNAIATKPYNKNTADPYTKIRTILMCGNEYESVWLGHQLSRHCGDNELRRSLALVRRVEQQQQKRIAALKPISETILETTIAYEMLAVDLTSALAKNEKDPTVKKALDFALLEDFDHLYRYANLLEGERGIKAERLVGKHAEIMPGRPTISEHRHPFDDIRPHITKNAALLTKLNVGIITAAEQQTMNYYMNVANLYDSEQGRKLYTEIGMIEEQHVSQYGSLKDTDMTWLECLLMHEYTECYLYYSCYKTESDERIKGLWEEFFEQEIAHLHLAAELLKMYEKKEWQQVIPDGTFPKLLNLIPSIEYVREVLKSVYLTADRDDYVTIDKVPDDAKFFKYQSKVNTDAETEPAHAVVKSYIRKNKQDYRWQTEKHPIAALQSRDSDNITVGRVK